MSDRPDDQQSTGECIRCGVQNLTEGVNDQEHCADGGKHQYLPYLNFTSFTPPLRRAVVIGREDLLFNPYEIKRIGALLPDNYVLHKTEHHLFIEGSDVAGWTLDGYVIPRLFSGLVVAKEVVYADGEEETETALNSGDSEYAVTYWVDDDGDILILRESVNR